MTCPKCGAEISDGTKFCTECGCKIESASEQPQSSTAPEIVPVTSENMQTIHNEPSVNNASNGKFAKFWNGLSLFSKIAAIAMAVVVILTIIALCTKTPGAIVFSILQLAGLVVAILMNNNVIPVKPQWVKHIVLAAAVLFTILNIASYTWGNSEEAEKPAATSQPSVTSQPSEASQPIVSDTPSSAASSEDTSVAAPPEVVENNDVTMDTSYYMYEDKDYQDVKAALEQLGFTNIKTEPVYDIVWGITKSGSVKSVSIGGNSSFLTGTVFPNNAEVIITYHLSVDDDPSYINLTKAEIDYIGKNYLDVEQEFKNLGFASVTVEVQTTYDSSHNDGEVFSVKVNGITFKNGDSFKPDAEITIKRYAVQQHITVNNNADFAALMKITDQTDADNIKRLISPLNNEIIEFDGCIALMMNHNNYKTRFDVALAGGDYYGGRVYGPLFGFEDVSFIGMNVTGTDTVAAGMNFHITAKVKGFSDEGCYVILEPISLALR